MSDSGLFVDSAAMDPERQRGQPLVLIVDDDRTVRIMLRRVLRENGYLVEEAGDGFEAIALFQRIRPDMVILDVMMPEVDGFQTCQEIRALPSGAHVPILLVTALDDLQSINHAYEIGATDFITKPINWILLTHRVRYIFRASQAFGELSYNEARLADAQRIARLGHWTWYVDLNRVHASDQVYRIYNLEVDDQAITLELFLRTVHRADRARAKRALTVAIHDKTGLSLDARIYVGGRKIRWVQLQAEVCRDEAGRTHHLLGTIQDISLLKEAEHELRISEEKFSNLFQYSNDATIVQDARGRIIDANQKTIEQFGYTRNELLKLHIDALYGPDIARVRQPATEKLIATGHVSFETDLSRKDATVFPAEVSASRFRIAGQWVAQTIVRDISERKRAEEQITFLAYQDPLTRLPNRRLFDDRLTQAIMSAKREARLVAVLFLDLDRFKRINDTLGHDAGDKLLAGVADRLRACTRSTDSISRNGGDNGYTIARLGGDEFTLLLTGLVHVQGAAVVARRILDALAQPIPVDEQQVFIGASIGVALYPHDGADPVSLLKNAESAMYHAKETGRNNYQFYTQLLNEAAFERFALEVALRRALEQNEFLVYYQPKINMRTKKIIGAEALIRWRNPEMGMVSPGVFIPLAEESGLIVPIGDWVLHAVCRQNKKWRDEGLPEIRIAVNISGVQFGTSSLVTSVSGALTESGLAGDSLELEITESSIMQEIDGTIQLLRTFKEMGITLSIDDFGTGYSSLSYLKRFPIDHLKIDQSFVREITTDAGQAAITRAIIALGHALKLSLIAEGVETQAQFDFLQTEGCEEMQGYLFSRPLPAEEFAELVRSQMRLQAPPPQQ